MVKYFQAEALNGSTCSTSTAYQSMEIVLDYNSLTRSSGVLI